MNQRHRHTAGFTLVEVMLAVAILASLTGLMWVSIANMFSTRDVIEQRSERFHQVRVTMNRMSQEIASAYLAGPEFGAEEIPGENELVAEAGDDEEAAEAALTSARQPIQAGMIGGDDEIHFTSFAYVRTMEREQASDHAEFGYFLRSDRNEEGRLVKKLMRRTDTSADPDLTSGGVVYTMLPEVESLEFEYWDAGRVELGTFEEVAEGRWVRDWNTTRRDQAGRLPTRVRIRLTLPPQNTRSESETFVTEAEIKVTEVLEFR